MRFMISNLLSARLNQEQTMERQLLLQRLAELSLEAKLKAIRVPFQKDTSLPKDPDEALKEIQRRAKERADRLGITRIKGKDWEEDILD